MMLEEIECWTRKDAEICDIAVGACLDYSLINPL